MAAKENEINGDGFELTDIVRFIRRSWLLILASAATGLVAAVVFLLGAPRHYEATISIQIAQMTDIGKGVIVAVETPAMLAQRMRLPSSYSAEALTACGIAPGGVPEALVSSIRVSTPRDLGPVVNLTLRRTDRDLARQCATAVFAMVREQHTVMLQDNTNEIQKELEYYQSRVMAQQELIASMEKGGLAVTVIYLVQREVIGQLLKKIDDIEHRKARVTPTRLMSPVYVTSDAVSPRWNIVINLGVLAGLLVGVLAAVGRAVIVAEPRA